MSTDILERIAEIAAEAGKGFQDAWALLLLVSPLALFAGYVIVYFSNAEARGRGKAAFVAFSDVCVFAFAALAVCAYAPEEAERAILYVGVALAAKAAYLVLYGALSLFPKKKSGPKPAAKPRVAEYVDMSEQFPPAVGAQRGSELKKCAVSPNPNTRATNTIPTPPTCGSITSFPSSNGSKAYLWARGTGWKCRSTRIF